MGLIRIAILAGVSSDGQVQDHASIPDQLETCRRVVKQLGGVEVATYVFDGYSRSGYDSLPDAMRDIPALGKAITDAEQDKYDVLMLDNYDRLGDLGQLVYTRFKRYRKQIYSARQSGKLQDPETYNPTLDESGVIDIHIQGILQSYRINKLQRGIQLGIRKRMEEGRFGRGFPSGYKIEGDALVRDEPVASLLVRMKDAYLAGATLADLIRMGNESGIYLRGSRWVPSTIWRILHNPFYCGKVFDSLNKTTEWRVSKAGNRYKKRKRTKAPTLFDGNHPALWTYEEYLQLVREGDERYKLLPRSNARAFSGLLICSICGKRAVVHQKKYKCKVYHPGRIFLPVKDAPYIIGRALVDALQNFDPSEEPSKQEPPDDRAAIAAIERRIEKIQSLALAEVYTEAQAREQVLKLRQEIRNVEAARIDKTHQRAQRERMKTQREALLPHIAALPEQLASGDPNESNQFLRSIISGVLCEGESYIFLWR